MFPVTPSFETTESFFVELRGVPSDLQVADGVGRGTIYNDDARQLDRHGPSNTSTSMAIS